MERRPGWDEPASIGVEPGSRVVADVRRAVLGLALLLCAGAARAEWQHELHPGFTVRAGLQAGFAAITMENANLGLGQVDFLTGERDGDPSWTEAHIKPIVGFASTTGWYGEASIVGATTFFDGDASRFADPGDGRFGIETAYLGWRSGDATDDTERVVVDLSLGRQTMDIGDGFLVDDGNFDIRNDGGVWLVPRQAFQRTLRARLDYRAWHADLFFLEADRDNDEPALAGSNIEYQFAAGGHAGVVYMHILDSNRPLFNAAREGMNIVSVRVNDARLPQLPQVGWWGEATREFGDGPFAEFDASAFYAEGIYHFEGVPWRPRLSYRYAYFSGDANPFDRHRHDHDPLFYGFDKRSWGTWFQGEVTGGWLLFNNNQRNHLVHLAANPHERVTVGVIGGRFHLVKGNYRGVPVSDRHFGDEFNLYTDWAVHENLFLTAGYGVLFPGRGAEQGIGDDEVFHLLELGMMFMF